MIIVFLTPGTGVTILVEKAHIYHPKALRVKQNVVIQVERCVQIGVYKYVSGFFGLSGAR